MEERLQGARLQHAPPHLRHPLCLSRAPQGSACCDGGVPTEAASLGHGRILQTDLVGFSYGTWFDGGWWD
jgi:hypothetical protein